ncbi:MAG TPA: hypothetical protein VEL28_21035 [Candidatus Binatia bacterium]|nr:hypothetical protein [Candidatus Binatia bacterium]
MQGIRLTVAKQAVLGGTERAAKTVLFEGVIVTGDLDRLQCCVVARLVGCAENAEGPDGLLLKDRMVVAGVKCEPGHALAVGKCTAGAAVVRAAIEDRICNVEGFDVPDSEGLSEQVQEALRLFQQGPPGRQPEPEPPAVADVAEGAPEPEDEVQVASADHSVPEAAVASDAEASAAPPATGPAADMPAAVAAGPASSSASKRKGNGGRGPRG